MITYVRGDLFTSPAQVLVNTVNTVGVMGKGIAKEFKAIYPEMFQRYQQLCESGELTVGKLLLFRTPHKWILNFPTKRHWRQHSRVEDIEAGLKTFAVCYADNALTSVAFPQLGCGNGELDWESQVRPIMEKYLGGLPIDIYIHIYERASVIPEHRDRVWMRNWLRSEPSSLAFQEFWDDLLHQICQPQFLGETIVAIEENGHETALVFRNREGVCILPKDDLLDIWQRFRSFGLLAPGDLPLSCRCAAHPLFDLLCRLPYVEESRFVPITSLRSNDDEPTSSMLGRDDARGLRLVPPTRGPSQVSLFQDSAVA